MMKKDDLVGFLCLLQLRNHISLKQIKISEIVENKGTGVNINNGQRALQ